MKRCVRLPDAYRWGEVYALEATCDPAVGRRLPEAAAHANALMEHASKAGMHEIVCRAHGHRAELGDATNAAAARMLATEIDNPVLQVAKAER